MDPRYAGSNSLIRDGAILTRDLDDILTTLGRPVSNIRNTPQYIEKTPKNEIVTNHARVVSELSSIPTTVDEVVRRCQVSAAAVADVLLSLELEGRLERHRGNRVSLI
jgi:DNA processing protein